MKKRFFVTGTDTEVGKTYVSCKILEAFAQQSFSTLGLKPVASGGQADGLALQAASSLHLPLETINPIHYPLPIAPHIAAQKANEALTISRCVKALSAGLQEDADMILIEGAGGWCVPLNDDEMLSDLALALQCEVILVVGLRLGCINHALLSEAEIKRSGATLTGWVINHIDPQMKASLENIETLKQFMTSPYLGEVQHGGQAAFEGLLPPRQMLSSSHPHIQVVSAPLD